MLLVVFCIGDFCRLHVSVRPGDGPQAISGDQPSGWTTSRRPAASRARSCSAAAARSRPKSSSRSCRRSANRSRSGAATPSAIRLRLIQAGYPNTSAVPLYLGYSSPPAGRPRHRLAPAAADPRPFGHQGHPGRGVFHGTRIRPSHPHRGHAHPAAPEGNAARAAGRPGHAGRQRRGRARPQPGAGPGGRRDRPAESRS